VEQQDFDVDHLVVPVQAARTATPPTLAADNPTGSPLPGDTPLSARALASTASAALTLRPGGSP